MYGVGLVHIYVYVYMYKDEDRIRRGNSQSFSCRRSVRVVESVQCSRKARKMEEPSRGADRRIARTK